ncbi:MAG: exonuclease domain-containing protein [Candidatus Glassbacteria bacterium]
MEILIKETCWIAFDTETTGLSPILDRVVEIGAVKFNSRGEHLGEFQILINPGVPIPPEVSAVHGITNEEVRNAPPMEEILPGFIEFLGTTDTVLLAHNASFDAGFMGTEMERARIEKPEHMILDTLSMSRKVMRGLSSHSLGYLAKELMIDVRGHHRALADSLIVKEIFLRLLADIGGIERLRGLLDYTHVYRFTGLLSIQRTGMIGFEHFQKAVEKETPIMMVYRGGSKGLLPRKITPLGIIEARGNQYIRAYCHHDCVEKEFRIDRIERFTPVEDEEVRS